MQLGVDTVASVERDIKARGGTPNVGGGGRGKHVLNTMDADFSDAGPGVAPVVYDFEAANPSGKLIAITITRHVPFGEQYSKLAADRRAALAKLFGSLKSKSATESTGSSAGCTLTLHESPDTGYLCEVYLLPN
jgi:hypothetical protein